MGFVQVTFFSTVIANRKFVIPLKKKRGNLNQFGMYRQQQEKEARFIHRHNWINTKLKYVENFNQIWLYIKI